MRAYQRYLPLLSAGINLQGRALRINPKTDRRTGPNADRPSYQPRGWGPRAPEGNENSYPNNRWNRDDSRPQWNAPAEDPKRVYVGGLNSGTDQDTLEAEIKVSSSRHGLFPVPH